MSKVVSTAKLVLFAAIFGAMIFVGGGAITLLRTMIIRL